MDDGKILEIKVVLDRTDADRQATEHGQQQAKMVDDVASAERQKTAIVDQQGKARNAKGQFASQAIKGQIGEQIAAYGRLGAAQQGLVDSGLAGYARMALGLKGLTALTGALGDAMQQADERYKKVARNFVEYRDKLAELATVMGEKPDNAFTLKNAQFNAAAGLNKEDALAFRTQFQNSGAQFKGSRINDAEFGQYEQQAAQLTAAKGFSPEQTGDLAGSLLGFADRRGMGANASEDALGKLGSGLAILGRGKGRNPVLTNQFSMLAAASLSEDSLAGSFTDSDQVATAISMMAEKHDAQAAEMVRASIRGLHDTKDEAGALNTRAGITPTTPYFEGLKKLAPVVLAESKAKNVPVQDILRSTYKDETTAEALATAINRGVEGGIIDDRMNYAKQNGGSAPALKDIADFRKSGRGQLRIAEANTALTEAQQGADDSSLVTLREQAKAELLKRGELGSTWQYFKDKVGNKLTGGAIPDFESNRIDDEARRLLVTRSGHEFNGGLAYSAGLSLPESYESRSEALRGMMADMRGQKIDPLVGLREGEIRPPVKIRGVELPVGAAMGQGDEASRQIAENNRLLAENNRLMALQNQPQQKSPPQATPIPPSIAPDKMAPVQRR